MSLPNRSPVSHRSRSRKRAISVESATTELTRLPGLEVAETKPEVKPEHWIESGPSKRLMLFSGRSHPELAQRIAEKLGIQVGDVSLRTFASGETYCRYEESIRGADLFIVQTSSPPVDQHLMELLIMIDAAKLASAKRITAVVPLYPYSRQDKKSRPRTPREQVRRDDRRRSRGVAEGSPRAQRRAHHERDRRRRRQVRRHDGRHGRHRGDARRGRAVPQGPRGEEGLRVRDARDLLA